MSMTINNTTITTRLTIIFDAGPNPDNEVYYREGSGDYQLVNNDGPALGTGNTESDVYIDNKTWLNVRSHTEVPEDVHALQCWNKGGTWTMELEKTDDSPNETIATQSDLPQWVTNVVIRCEAQDLWNNKYESDMAAVDRTALAAANDDTTFKAKIKEAHDAAVTAANSERETYLSGHSITY
jgi:hypothetical protein